MEYIDRADYSKKNTQYQYEHGMYELSPAPPKLELQEYIKLYFAEKDEKYFCWFLHSYERTINNIAHKSAEKHHMAEHFTGIKSAVVFGIYEALLRYEPESGVDFLAFQKGFVTDRIDEYIRTMQSGITTMTVDTYPVLKKVMALYHQRGNRQDEESITTICEAVGKTEKTVRRYIRIGLQNESRVDLDGKADKDGNKSDFSTDDLDGGHSSQTDKMYFRMEQNAKLAAAYEKLEYREQLVVAARLGFCPKCFSTTKIIINDKGKPEEVRIKKQPFFDIALSHQLSSAEAVENIYSVALEKMRKNIK